jgi:hypothetical protein
MQRLKSSIQRVQTQGNQSGRKNLGQVASSAATSKEKSEVHDLAFCIVSGDRKSTAYFFTFSSILNTVLFEPLNRRLRYLGKQRRSRVLRRVRETSAMENSGVNFSGRERK